MIRYKCMLESVYDDTLKSGIVYKQGNNYVQAYYTSYGWSRCHLMAQKNEAHDKLFLMLNRDRVPQKMIVYKSREQSLGAFSHKCREEKCHLHNSKPFLPWSHMDEGCICRLNRGLLIQLINTGSIKRLWDHCIWLQAIIFSHTAHRTMNLTTKCLRLA